MFKINLLLTFTSKICFDDNDADYISVYLLPSSLRIIPTCDLKQTRKQCFVSE